MEAEQNDNVKPEKRRIWLKLAIVLLVFMNILLIYGLFLGALTGASSPILGAGTVSRFMFPSILLLGLLFQSIWSLRNKKKQSGFWLGALIGFILYFSAVVTARYFQAEEHSLDQAVAASNEGLPKMINEGTRLDSVAIDQKTKSYSLNMSLINLAQSELDLSVIHEIFETTIKPTSCGDETLKIFFNEGYKVNLVYKDKNGLVAAKYTINPADCKL